MTGIADLKLNGLRVAALRSEGRLPAGASVGLRLKTMHRGAWRDPLLIHTGEVVHAWAMCLETSLPSEAVLESVLEGSRGILRQKSPWARCHNPAQALLLALARVGGSMCSATRFRGPSGEEVDLRFFSPGRAVAVARRMAASASDILAISKYNCWRSEIHWGPLGKVLFGKASDGLTRHERNIVRSLVSGTHWPQARLAKHKKSASDLCKLCGCRGTLFHRGFDCPWCGFVPAHGPPPRFEEGCLEGGQAGGGRGGTVRQVSFSISGEVLRISRGPRGALGAVCRSDAWMEVGGAIFVDGSAFHTKFGACRRAGWAAVQIDRAGRFVACMYGVVPRGWGPEQWARDGEDFAFHMLGLASRLRTETLACRWKFSVIVLGPSLVRPPRPPPWTRGTSVDPCGSCGGPRLAA